MSTVEEVPAKEQTPDVVALHWPAERKLREERRARGGASLLLIDPGESAPETDAVLEDWAFTTAALSELNARREAVMNRVAVLSGDTASEVVPMLDKDNVFRIGDRSLVLAPIEVRLLRAFLEHPGTVQSRDTLSAAVWPDVVPKSNSLSVRLTHLRKRLAPLGISILTFPNHGYMLEMPDSYQTGK